MFRFTIRDVLCLTVVAALAAAWWSDHRKLAALNEQYRIGFTKMALRLIPLESFPQGAERIDAIYKSAQHTPPPPESAAEIIYHVRHDKDVRIRLRAMGVLPHLSERTEAISVLIGVLRDRDVERVAGGLIPQYAASYLAQMNATEAIGPIEEWLHFLEVEIPFEPEMRSVMIKSAQKNLATLQAASAPPVK